MHDNELRAGPFSGPNMERQILEQFLVESLAEKKRARRWGIFFKLILVFYFLVLLAMIETGRQSVPPSGKYTALVDLEGVIMSDRSANADYVSEALREAFKSPGTQGVILRANSPGGSPVQAGYLYDEIKRLREKYPDIPLYAVVTDYCASACYYIAAAAKNIYANKASTVGSIGVLYNAFGYVELMKKLGIERRLLTAGENKGFLDEFSPLDDKAKAHAHQILDQVHQQFIQVVKEGRGDRLKETADMFSGLFWTGEKAKEMGLIDDLHSTSFVAREIIKAEKIVDFTHRENLLDSFARKFGESVVKRLFSSMSSSSWQMH